MPPPPEGDPTPPYTPLPVYLTAPVPAGCQVAHMAYLMELHPPRPAVGRIWPRGSR